MSLFLLLHGAHVRAIGRVSETDTAGAIRPAKAKTVGRASEADTARAITHARARTVGRASETDTAGYVSTPYGAAVLADSPTSYWRLNEASGTVAEDLPGTNDGTHVSSPTLGAHGSKGSDPGVAVEYNGSNQTTLPGPAHGAGSGDVTIEFWFLWTGGRGVLAADGGDPSWRMIYDANGTNTAFGVQVAPGIHHNFRVGGTGAFLQVANYQNNWHHFAFVKSGTNLKAYIDGAVVLNEADAGVISAPTLPWRVAVVPGTDYSGKVDEIAMYPTALSAARIAAHIAAAAGSPWYTAVGRASETDTARAITHARARTVGRASETDTARAVTRQKRKALGQASETDTARPITAQHARGIGRASETDTAGAVTSTKRKAVAQASETDSAQTVRAQRTYTVSRASETDTAGAVTSTKRKAIARATETDSAQAISAQRPYPIGRASETDTAGAVTSTKRKAIGQASETDSAQAISAQRPYSIGQPSETDTARQVTPRKRVSVAPASETDTAGAITSTKRKAVARASETDSAQAMTTRKRRQLGQATETDTAQEITAPASGSVAVSVALEIDTAQALTRRKRRQLGQATETDTARALIRGRDLQVISGPTPDEISEVAGFRTSTFEWETAADFDEWKVKVVPLAASPHTSGTTIGTANGSANMTGGAGTAATPITSTIDGRDLSAASPGDGDKRIKVFVLSGSEWSP